MSPAVPPPTAQLLDLRGPEDCARELRAVGAEGAAGAAEGLERIALRLESLAPPEVQRLRELSPPGLELYGQGPALLAAGSRGALARLAAALAADAAGAGLSALAHGIQRCLDGPPGVLAWGRRRLDFRPRPLVMGILNCTPDSFYPGSRRQGREAALAAARAMIADRADLLDVGGESTRPGSDPVPAGEEMERVVPVIEALRRETDIPLSVDTRKPEVAAAALEAGADLVNDVSAARAPGMSALVARRGVPIVLMHMRGEPKSMQAQPRYDDTVSEVLAELAASVEAAAAAGVDRGRILGDPGIGFGKRRGDNLCLLRHLRSLRSLGCPILIGVSRKSFLGAVTRAPVEDRLAATLPA